MRRLFVFQDQRLLHAGKESHQLFQPWLALDGAAQAPRALVCEPRLGHMPICQYETVADVKTCAHKLKFRDGSIAFGRQRCGFVSILNGLSGFVGLRFRITQRPAGTLFDEHERTGNQANAAAIVDAQHLAQREGVEHLLVGLHHLGQLIVSVLKLLSLSDELCLLRSDDAPIVPGFIKLGETNVEGANDAEYDDGKGYDLRAGIDLANQLAGKFAQEDLGVITTRCRGRFHGRLFDERRNVRAVATPGHERRRRLDRKEVNRRARRTNPDFISVIESLVGFNWTSVEFYFQTRIEAFNPVDAI